MRELNIGSKHHTKVICNDEPGQGGTCHEYQVVEKQALPDVIDHDTNPYLLFADVSFQNGAIKETGVNGCHNEDLIVIVIDRLQGFQSGEFKCRENAIALTKLEEALLWLNKRTVERIQRGVEGTSIK
jgi:hypothetical protein